MSYILATVTPFGRIKPHPSGVIYPLKPKPSGIFNLVLDVDHSPGREVAARQYVTIPGVPNPYRS